MTVNYTSLDDSTAAAGEWDPTQTAADARKAATDPKTVYYIGEFNSGASEVSIPILNQAGIPQVSPANTYVGLTSDQGRQRARRAAEVLPDRQAHVPANRPERLDPGRSRPDGDEGRGLHEGRRRQRQGGLRRRPGDA